jgi:hypothetical protein
MLHTQTNESGLATCVSVRSLARGMRCGWFEFGAIAQNGLVWPSPSQLRSRFGRRACGEGSRRDGSDRAANDQSRVRHCAISIACSYLRVRFRLRFRAFSFVFVEGDADRDCGNSPAALVKTTTSPCATAPSRVPHALPPARRRTRAPSPDRTAWAAQRNGSETAVERLLRQ